MTRHKKLAEPMHAFLHNVMREMTFDSGVFLLTKARAGALEQAAGVESTPVEPPQAPATFPPLSPLEPHVEEDRDIVTVRVTGEIPPESWNKLGIKLIPKLKSGKTLTLRLDASVDAEGPQVDALRRELRQVLMDLGLGDRFRVE